MSIGPTELFFIFIILLLLFGAKRVPEIAKAFGKASREFKKAKSDILDYSEKIVDEAEKAADPKAKQDLKNSEKQDSKEQ